MSDPDASGVADAGAGGAAAEADAAVAGAAAGGAAAPGATVADTAGPPPLPAQHLDREVLWLWRVEGLIGGGVALAIGRLAARPFDGLPALLVSVLLPLAVLAVGVLVVPPVRYGRWLVELDDERLDLRHGTWTVRRTLVPMRRVQHVDSASGVLERTFGVATVTVHTAGGKIEIPGLREDRAGTLARRISDLARVDDD